MAGSNSQGERRRGRRREVRSPVDRIFAVVATPWPAVAGLLLLSGVHLAEMTRLLQETQKLWSVDSLRAVGGGLIAACALAMFVARILPVLRPGGVSQENIAPDLVLPVEDIDVRELGLGRSGRSDFQGKLPALGVALLFVGLIGYAVMPLFRGHGLVRGGELLLTPGSPTEAAEVVREGLRVRENLGGWRFEIDRIDPGSLQGQGGSPGQVFLRLTRIQTGEETEAVLRQGQRLQVGEYTLALESIAPAPRPAGVWVDIKDTSVTPARDFALKLTPGRSLADPDGPGRFQVRRIEERYLGGTGAAVQGIVQIAEEVPDEFWLFERSPSFDTNHRGGRYALSFRELVPGHLVKVRLSQPDPMEAMPIWLLLLSLGVVLLFIKPQVSRARLVVDERELVLVSSLQDAEGAALDAIDCLLPPDAYDDEEVG